MWEEFKPEYVLNELLLLNNKHVENITYQSFAEQCEIDRRSGVSQNGTAVKVCVLIFSAIQHMSLVQDQNEQFVVF